MIKLEKRLMPYCEECEMFAPCSMKIRGEAKDSSLCITTVVMCHNADLCSNAVHQYNNFTASCAKPPQVINDINITGAALMPDGSMELEGMIND